MHGFASVTLPYAIDRGGVASVETTCDTDVSFIGRNPVRDVESDPSQPRNVGFGPGMTSTVVISGFGKQVTAYVPGRDSQAAGHREKYVGVVLANAVSR